MADFQIKLDALQSLGIGVAAVSVDPEEEARALVDALGLTFPVGFGLNCEETAERLGAFYEPEKRFLHASAFLLRPGGTIVVSSYSSGAIGRMVPGDVMPLVELYKSREKQ